MKRESPLSKSGDNAKQSGPDRLNRAAIHSTPATPAAADGHSSAGHDFSDVPVNSPESDTGHAESASTADLLKRAAIDHASPLDPTVRGPLESSLGRDFSGVRVHQGAGSAQASEQLGARAFTLGNRIHLGAEVPGMSQAERSLLLTHEAVHTAQQGGQAVAVQGDFKVSHPGDAAETEAQQIAAAIHESGGSRSMALRNQLRTTPVGSPLIQRDLKQGYDLNDGRFDLNLKTESHAGAKSGMSGTIKFTPNATAPDDKLIKLVQTAKTTVGSTGADYMWTGGEADRNSMMTTADAKKGIKGGYFIDHLAADPAATPRTAKADKRVSPYYRTYAPNSANSQDGKKDGASIKHASLWDYPGDSSGGDFSFETVAKGVNSGHYYASVRWGFTISDAAKGKVTNEWATYYQGPTGTFRAALKKFNEFYKNPGASTAPAK